MRTMLLVGLLWPSLALAADEGPVVVRAARMFDAKTDRVVSPGVLVVRGGKLETVGPSSKEPLGAEVIDLGDATLLPGFIDAHVHIAWERSDDWKQDRLDTLERTVPERTLWAAQYAQRTLMAGFTSVRDLGALWSIAVGLREAVAKGRAVGPRVIASDRAISATGGHCDPEVGFREGAVAPDPASPAVADGPDALRAAVRRLVRAGADVIKVCATAGVSSKTADVDSPQLTQAELDAVVDEAHALRKKVAAHAHGNEGAKRAIRAGADSIEHGSFLDDEALELMRQKGTWLVPTLLVHKQMVEKRDRGVLPPWQVPKLNAAEASHARAVRRALEKGVRIALGTDSGVFPHGRNAEEFALLVGLGMTPAQALRAGTSAAAELLGIADRVGTLEPGKLADVVAVPGDPLKDVRRAEQVFFVMKEGVVHRNDRAAAGAAR